MFSPKTFNSSRANFSPFTPGNVASPGGKARKPEAAFTPQRWPTGTPSSRRGTPAGNWSFQVEETTTQQRLELFGGSLPVVVTEVLTQCNRSSELSLKLDSNGWAWLVWGRKLLLWKYKATHTGKGSVVKELSLPPCDKPYTADMVTVLTYPGEASNAACVAVSPAGTVRYWCTLAHEGSYVEVSCAEGANQCAAIMALQQQMFTCVVATTTSSLYLVTPTMGQNQLQCRQLRAPQGMLTGIGRRVSSLFRAGASQAYEAPFYRMVSGEVIDSLTQAFYVLCGSHLQKWIIQQRNEKMVYQCEVEKMWTDCIANAVWGQDSAKLSSLQVWLLDVQPTRDGVVILGAAMNPEVSNDIYFGLGSLHTEGTDPPPSFISFTAPKKFTEVHTGEDPCYQLVIPELSAASAYLQDAHTIMCMSVNSSSQPVDKVEFHSAGDRLLGGGSADGQAVFFSFTHGLVTMKGTGMGGGGGGGGANNTQQSANDSMADPNFSQMDTTIGPSDPSKLHEMSISEDKTQRLKAAFIQACRKNMNEAQSLVDALFPRDTPLPDPGLDHLVGSLSEEMIDDYPASDPRWAESVPNVSGGSGSLILQHQLEDKLKAHEVLIQFLHNVNLWDKLHTTMERDTSILTRLLLCEHAEKITAAKSLRELHTQHQPLLDTVIKLVLQDRDAEPSGGALTPHDVFYREVSLVGDVLVKLVDYEDQMLHGQMAPRDLVSLITTCNNVILGCVGEACQYRLSKQAMYESSSQDGAVAGAGAKAEYLPWTASTGPQGIRTLLIAQYDITLKEALREAKDVQERGALYQQLLQLADKVLEGFSAQLDSLKFAVGSPHYTELLTQYEQRRLALCKTLLQEQQYERAASLAEKYCEFAVLVQLCEETNNEERLHRYMNQFHARGFAEFVFRWYVDMGQRGKLMASSLASHPQLARFLAHGDNKYMSWLHDINAGDFYQGHCTLQDLAMDESQYLAKKKTLLSLSKLCALAASDDAPDDAVTNTELINEQLELVMHQEQLPLTVLEAMGEEAETMRVLSPKELIEQYVCSENIHSNEFDFKKALDLMQYLDKSDAELDAETLLLHIWSQAIMKDDWASIDTTDPLENSKETVFFKTVELAYTEGMNLHEYLPTIDKLLAFEGLGPLRHNKNFQYLVRAGYEQIQRILK